MLNLLPLRGPAHSLLYGKTGLQRIKIGKCGNSIEIDKSSIDEIYSHSRNDVVLHNDFVPLKHKNFMEYKLVAYHLIEAYENPEKAFKTTLAGMSFFDKLSHLYSNKKRIVELHTAIDTTKHAPTFPIQGKNV
ncbi:hypothetical protein BEWA_025520 [Theileria equi strain WA]|uniref:Uncharacterized protein n=1 Tax=Theileria equi strain WA TaxID=1537102 RepID=L0AWS1_THEEQ|nr:hypothetical protein BEWA_025520 [Theileria equi strain WA]AFZ79703.1 hypothetical protein BEWA_025520 [Theileria equi strain WA]|eukprot:XP_004829369.1 hypothetical protein BEWA_025520 [Theileria equi strain WA]